MKMLNMYIIFLMINIVHFAIAQNKTNTTSVPWKYIKDDYRRDTLNSARGILFVMCCLFAGVAIHFGSKKYHYPYTVGCFLFGVLIGLMEIYSAFVRDFTRMTRMNPSDMLLAFLPILIFESSFGMDAHMFYKALPQCLILAVFGFLLCTCLTAVFAKFVLQFYGWSWLTTLVFGSIVSATDPVAVVALLKEMRMPHSFTILIEGESLLNDGVAIVLYELFTHQLASNKPFVYATAFIELLKTCIGAPIFGYILGKMTEWILIRIYISPVSEMTTTLVIAYVTYFVAERFLGISAVLAVVLYGVTLSANKMCISPESESLIYTDWRLLSIYSNTLIFMIVGILVTDTFSQYFVQLDAWLILGNYIFLTLLRSLMVLIFYPALQRVGYGLNWKESIILSWGGLRGAIGLALASMLTSNPHLPSSVNAPKVLVQVSGIIVLTLIVNANTVKYVMKAIKFKDITLVKRLSMGNAIACVTGVKEKSLRICKRDWKLMKADWQWVTEKTSLDDPYEGGLYGDDPNMCSLFIPYGTCNECLTAVLPYVPSETEMEELKEAARKKVLQALKGNLWKQFRRGLLQRRSLRLLCLAVDNASDTTNMYLKTEDVKSKFMKVRRYNHWLETKLSYLMTRLTIKETIYYDEEKHNLRKSNGNGFRSWCTWIYCSHWFKPLVSVVIVLNVIHIAADIYLMVYSDIKYKKLMSYFAVFFVFFYVWEVIVMVTTLHWNVYVKNPWNKFDFALITLAVLEGILDLSLSQYPLLHTSFSHNRILIIFRFTRYFHIPINLFIGLLSVIRNYASSELYYAYDVGRGFLFATEAILKNIDMIVDFGPCAKIPIAVCEENITEMLHILEEFEENYPAIAVALESNRTARKILNRVKSVLDHMKKRSLILQEDAREMKSILFKMTKMVVYAPRARSTTENIERIFEEVSWMSSELAQDVYENHLLVYYKTGDVIQEEGQNHKFVHIIVKGIVKIDSEKYERGSLIHPKLPNVDSVLFFEDFKNRNFYDFLKKSQTIGLLGYLQRTPSATTAICVKDCELIQIEHSFLEEAREKHHNLLYCMWRSVAIKMSVRLLKQKKVFMTYTEEDIYLQLLNGVLPDLTELTSLFIPPVVKATTIIQGRVKDTATQMEYIAPSYISCTSRSLQLLDDIKKRPRIIMLFVIDQKYDLNSYTHWMTPEEISEICSSHTVGQR